MAKVTEKFMSRILNQMLLEAVKNLNMVKDALDPTEQKAIAQINEVTMLIAQIEV